MLGVVENGKGTIPLDELKADNAMYRKRVYGGWLEGQELVTVTPSDVAETLRPSHHSIHMSLSRPNLTVIASRGI